MIGMSPTVVASPPAEVSALTAILADPAKSAAALKKITEEQEKLRVASEALAVQQKEIAAAKQARDADVADLERRERAMKGREDAVRVKEETVAAMKADYEKKLAHLRSMAGALAA